MKFVIKENIVCKKSREKFRRNNKFGKDFKCWGIFGAASHRVYKLVQEMSLLTLAIYLEISREIPTTRSNGCMNFTNGEVLNCHSFVLCIVSGGCLFDERCPWDWVFKKRKVTVTPLSFSIIQLFRNVISQSYSEMSYKALKSLANYET